MSDKDTIYRQDAIDALMEILDRPNHAEFLYGDEIYRVLTQMSSAQPTQIDTSNTLKALNCVERQAAIDTEGLDEQIKCEMCRNPMHTVRGCDGNCKYDEVLYEKIIQLLNKRITPLPSAQPQRKTGKWIYKHDQKQFFCDQCGEPSLTDDDVYIYSMDFPNFCQNCGADMRNKDGVQE